MPAGVLPRGPDLRRHPLAGRDEMAERAKWRRLRQARFEQPVIDGWHAQQHARLEALHRLGDARRGGPALQQDVARAHAERREHVADRIGEVKPRGREQAIVLRAAENLFVILGAHPDIAVMMLDRLRHTGRAGGHHPERRVDLALAAPEQAARRTCPSRRPGHARGGSTESAAAPWPPPTRPPPRTRCRSPAPPGGQCQGSAQAPRDRRGSISRPRSRRPPSRRDASRQDPACRASACRHGRRGRRRLRGGQPRTG